MKFFIVAVCLLGVAYAEVSLEAVLQAKWNNFKASHGKQYNKDEEPKRLEAFLSNSLAIELHNERAAKGLETFTMGHNQFSDLTLDEFKEKMLGAQVPALEDLQNVTTYKVSNLGLGAPASVDWRSMLGPVKNQGGCGSCYAFASVAPLEAALARRNVHVRLSEQELVDCTKGKGNNGCSGGWMTGCYDYIKNQRGLSTEGAYSYQAKEQSCRPSGGRQGAVQNYVNVNNEAAMTDALAKVGPIAIALQAGVKSFQMYKGGVYNDGACGAGNIDHGVTNVGYGSANGINYYIIRNSWGSGWGEGGYMRIARNIRHVANYGYYPTL